MNVYFDNAATTPLRKEVIKTISRVMEECFGNPSSTHSFGRTAKTYIETARKGIASLLNALPQEIIFTSGGTESDNMILSCAVKDLNVKTIISSPIEHHAVIHALDALKKNQKINVRYLKLDAQGNIDLNDLEESLKIDNSKKLVSLMHVNNEIGNILNLHEVGNLCHNNNALFHTDAVQGVGHYLFDLKNLPVDFLSSASHKYHGPKGIGFSFVRKNSGLEPFIYGGAQERGLRAGTESVHNIVGMHEALDISHKKLEVEKKQILFLKNHFIKGLIEIFPNVHFNGNSSENNLSTYTLLNVALPIDEKKASLLDFHLDLKGIACSKGSACQSGSSQGSHVLNHIQNQKIKKMSSLRFSFSSFNNIDEVDYVLETLKEFVTQ
ncbi:MAG: cysteine desulfurase [Flavobacteriaceae bacterium]|nr:cysteine desulfurase [Flavobacteriaceae bacterium]|tara:strand:+ start:9243 stop:10388 length:1146 start_codon:yes stop_codon:yes gene_type:complete